MTKWPELRTYIAELLERKMPDEVNYHALLRKYMLSVIYDNRSVALRCCAEDDDYTDQELMALAQIVREYDPPAADYLESAITARAKKAERRKAADILAGVAAGVVPKGRTIP